MKSDKLQDAIGEIKGEYVAEAHGTGKEKKQKATKVPFKKKWIAIGTLAACFVIAGVVLIPNIDYLKGIALNTSSEEGYDSEGYVEDINRGTYSEMGSASSEGESEMAKSSTLDDTVSTFENNTLDGELADEPVIIDDIDPEALVLTAGEWNDNDNWPFFTNLVNSELINFPSFGLDPRYRIKVTVVDGSDNPLKSQNVKLFASDGTMLWEAKTDKNGIAYLFRREGESAAYVEVNSVRSELTSIVDDPDNSQGDPVMEQSDDIVVVAEKSASSYNGLQVMFIIDTTGSMGDELAYLQCDFSSIAKEVASSDVTYSVNFYRDEGDEYVTKTNSFTSDAESVQSTIDAEYAAGGNDEPEAVAQILDECITSNDEWQEDANKLIFMVFDAPPHLGTEDVLVKAIQSAAAKGIRIVPVIASSSTRDTELFGRAMAICTGGSYVFLTDDSGVGNEHMEPIIGDYEVELLHDIIVRIINEEK